MRTIQIGDFLFYPSSGELLSQDGSNRSIRLAPQPCQLLLLLVDSHPEVVTREEIQEHLWPGVPSDFDSNLHFCVRKIRAAFGESASNPNYVETIPRRGYRMIASIVEISIPRSEMATSPIACPEEPKLSQSKNVPEIELASQLASPVHNDQKLTKQEASQHHVELSENLRGDKVTAAELAVVNKSNVMRPAFWAVATFVMLSIVLLLSTFWPANVRFAEQGSESLPNIRVAIMPFKSNSPEYGKLGNGEIALDLLSQLSSQFDVLDVIGPSTTEQYVTAQRPMREIAKATKADLIVNGRFVSSEESSRLLVEFIRTDDGRHVWVKYFDQQTSNAKISRLVSAELQKRVNEFAETER